MIKKSFPAMLSRTNFGVTMKLEVELPSDSNPVVSTMFIHVFSKSRIFKRRPSNGFWRAVKVIRKRNESILGRDLLRNCINWCPYQDRGVWVNILNERCLRIFHFSTKKKMSWGAQKNPTYNISLTSQNQSKCSQRQSLLKIKESARFVTYSND